MQKKLDTYFKFIPKYDDHNKKVFIFDPEHRRAFFTTKPETTDKYVVLKSGIKLFYRSPSSSSISKHIPVIQCRYSVPLVKSNLQKAVRRCNTQIAIQSALALIQMAPMEFLRRLPVICIEDVCLMDSFSIIVWLMMADKDYGKLTPLDIDILLQIVVSLCETRMFFPYVKNDLTYAFTPEALQFCPNADQLLSLHFRSEYGGLKGDMQMLRVAIDYYRLHPAEVFKTEFQTINYELVEREIEILVEAIDFHPFPQMLTMLNKLVALDRDTIKQFIWFVESGYNVRKQETIVLSVNYEERPQWRKIEKHLESVRVQMIKET